METTTRNRQCSTSMKTNIIAFPQDPLTSIWRSRVDRVAQVARRLSNRNRLRFLARERRAIHNHLRDHGATIDEVNDHLNRFAAEVTRQMNAGSIEP